MTPAESMKDEGPPLTAADLDRLAHEWSERRVVTNSVEHREKADRARLERLKTALPSLIALARRGLEAGTAKIIDGFDGRMWEYAINLGHGHPADMCPRCNGVGRRAYAATSTWRGGAGGSTITTDVCDVCWGSGDKTRSGTNLREVYARMDALRESAESKLAAALAEVERVRGRLAMAEAVTFKAAARVVSQMDTPPAAAQVALALAQHRALMVRTLGEQGDMAAAEAQAGQAAKP